MPIDYGTNNVSTSGVLNVSNISVSGSTISTTTNNSNIIIQPSGTGALQRDSAGNARGQYAVDWQTVRSSGTMVAGGHYSVVGGGYNNRAGGFASVVCGGRTNSATYGGIVSGSSNISTGGSAFVGGGSQNSATNERSVVCGGSNNISNSYNGFVGAGINNTAYYSFGPSVICGGYLNVASGNYCVVGGGSNNIASGQYSAILGGQYNIALHDNVFILGSNITSSASDTTYVQSLVASDNVSISGVLTATNGTITTLSTVPTVVSQTGLSTNQGNWNPGAGDIVRMSATTGVSISGIVLGVEYTRVLINIGSTHNITLKHEASAASSGNRIITSTGGDHIVPPTGAATILYDTVSTRWRIL